MINYHKEKQYKKANLINYKRTYRFSKFPTLNTTDVYC